jgi:hypothetical protein
MHEAADAIKRYRNRHPNNSLEIARTLARIIVRRSHELKGRGVGTAVQVTVMPRAALGQEWISMGLFQDPLDGVTSIEFNPRRRTADGHPIFTGPNLVCDGMVLTSPAMAFGSFEEIGPREPFREPEHQGRSGPQTRRGAASGVPAKVVLPELVRIAVEAGLEG